MASPQSWLGRLTLAAAAVLTAAFFGPLFLREAGFFRTVFFRTAFFGTLFLREAGFFRAVFFDLPLRADFFRAAFLCVDFFIASYSPFAFARLPAWIPSPVRSAKRAELISSETFRTAGRPRGHRRGRAGLSAAQASAPGVARVRA